MVMQMIRVVVNDKSGSNSSNDNNAEIFGKMTYNLSVWNVMMIMIMIMMIMIMIRIRIRVVVIVVMIIMRRFSAFYGM